MRVYLSGAMRGRENVWYRFPEFDEAARVLREQGHSVVNPAELDRERGFDPKTLPEDHDWTSIPSNFDMQTCIMDDIKAILECDAVAVLPKSDKSAGVKAEVAVAQWAGKTIYDFVDGELEIIPKTHVERVQDGMNAAFDSIAKDSKPSILAEADPLTSGDRKRDYDAAGPNHERIAALWNAYLGVRKGKDAPVSASDVAAMMILLKLARHAYTPKRDNCVDIAGYARCLAQIEGLE